MPTQEKHLLSGQYEEDVQLLERELRAGESFDIISRRLQIGTHQVFFLYVDGFVKDLVMQRLMQFFYSCKEWGDAAAFVAQAVPYVEVEMGQEVGQIVQAVLAGQAVMLGDTFGPTAVLIDARTYPARETAEPENDRVVQGARDGFVETLIFNTALLRRRIRDPRLTMHYVNLGGASGTDVVVCYMEGVADPAYVRTLCDKLQRAAPRSLTLGFQSLAECLIHRRWYNPFPKIRTTERPDAAAAEVLEGRVLVFCDTAPQVMLLPTSLPDFLQETDDFYFPPLTGTYLRLLRAGILLLSLFLTPVWYLLVEHPAWLPASLQFLVPTDPGALPLLLQLVLAELAVDGLELASMNTPSLLSNSLGVIGGLLLGDFAVEVGWFCGDVILYIAFIAVASFTQQNHELGFAFKFLRLLLLFGTAIAGIWGLAVGTAVILVLLATNSTVNGGRSYLYPLCPFHGKALCHLLFRLPKRDLRK